MKISFTILFTFALAGLTFAHLPRKASISSYKILWENSPFTAKPLPTPKDPAPNPLDQYALAGVTPIQSNGYRVILIDKNQLDKSITVDTGGAPSDFKILGITRKAGDPLGTTVKMSFQSKVGTVSYDRTPLTASRVSKVESKDARQMPSARPRVAPPSSR